MILFFLFLLGCTTVPTQYPMNPLIKEILVAKDGFLVNRHCKEYLPTGSCLEMIETRYDLGDPVMRKTLRDLGFACKVGPRIFTICADQPGLCRSYDHGWFKTPKLDYYSIKDDWKFLASAETKCFQKDTYSFLSD